MLLKDSIVAPRMERGNRREQQFEQYKKWVAEQTQHAFYVKEHDLSPANAQRQLGQQFWPNEFEARLKKLNPNLHFEVNPFNSSKKALFHLRAGEGKTFICAYENSIMPEHSIVKLKEELVQDFDFIRTDRTTDGRMAMHLERTEMPRYVDTEGGLELEPGAIPLGMKKVLIPWGEYVRGWRTVTIKLVEARIASPQEIENIFGADDRPEWAKHSGKRPDLVLPW